MTCSMSADERETKRYCETMWLKKKRSLQYQELPKADKYIRVRHKIVRLNCITATVFGLSFSHVTPINPIHAQVPI